MVHLAFLPQIFWAGGGDLRKPFYHSVNVNRVVVLFVSGGGTQVLHVVIKLFLLGGGGDPKT